MPLNVPSSKYTLKNFFEKLSLEEQYSIKNLKVACYLTNFSNWDEDVSLKNILIQNSFTFEDYGEIKKITKKIWDNFVRDYVLADFYLYLYPNNKVLICITNEKMDIIKAEFWRIINFNQGIYYLYVGNSTFNFISRKILEMNEDNQCIYFSAKHLPQFITKGQIRPEMERTIIYHASDGDGLIALKEIKELYGVLPRIMTFKLLGIGTIEINNTGIFTLESVIDEDLLKEKLFDIINIALEDVLIKKNIISKSEYKIISIKKENKIIEVSKTVPWRITFKRKILDNEKDAILKVFEDNDYALFNEINESGGSFRINGMIFDNDKDNLFSIFIDNDEIVISPLEKTIFDSFFKLYQVILDNFDPEAEIMEVT